jgi:prepilin-type processing-associated H-X9-DG protein
MGGTVLPNQLSIRFGPLEIPWKHPGSANFLFRDGSVRFLKVSIIARTTYAALGGKAGSEASSADSDSV